MRFGYAVPFTTTYIVFSYNIVFPCNTVFSCLVPVLESSSNSVLQVAWITEPAMDSRQKGYIYQGGTFIWKARVVSVSHIQEGQLVVSYKRNNRVSTQKIHSASEPPVF